MRNSKMKISALVFVMALSMSGCGERPIELTKSEEAIVVNYAAHVVTKYNQKQTTGLCYVDPKQNETESDTEEPADNNQTQSAQKEQKAQNIVTSEAGSQAEENTVEKVTLTQAVALDGIDVTYAGSELCKSYVEPKSYALDASSGNSFLVLHFKLKNQGTSDAGCDMLARRPVFKVVVNDAVKSVAKTTILLNDLGTYQGTLSAGQEADAVLLFEVPVDQVTSVDKIELEIKQNNNTQKVAL